MKWTAIIMVAALVIGTAFHRAYMTIGWYYFDMPYLDVIAPAFHLDGEAAEDAIYSEIWLEFIAGTALALFGARFFWQKLSNCDTAKNPSS